MKFLSLRGALVAGLSSLALLASSGARADFRHYLSTSGSDANPCTRLAPCRLLPAALAVVDPGGEIWMLDSGNYNLSPVLVTKSVTILSIPGQLGSVAGLNGAAFNIAGAGINVTLQNLNILSFGNTGDIGVLVTNAAHVSILNCNIFGFRGLNAGSNNGVGIWVNPGANAPKVNVVNSVVRNNSSGIVVAGGRVTISKTHVLANSGTGIVSGAAGGAVAAVHVSDSVSSGNANGFVATGCDSGCSSQMYVIRSVATENTSNGFLSDGGTSASMVVHDSMSTRNGTIGFNNTAGTFNTRGTNTVFGNGNASSSGVLTQLNGL